MTSEKVPEENAVNNKIASNENLSSSIYHNIGKNPITLQENSTCGCAKKDIFSSKIVNTKPTFIYAIGQLQIRFPNMGLEKEFAQAIGKAETPGLADREAIYSALSIPENRYLLHQVCWVFTVEGFETYLIYPRDPAMIDMLLHSFSTSLKPTNVVAVIGIRGPMAGPDICNGLNIPLGFVDQIYSFDLDELTRSVPKPENIPQKQFHVAIEELFYRIIQLSDNVGSTDEHRALNYLLLRYPAIFSKSAQLHSREFSLASVEVHPTSLSTNRKIVNVVFTYLDRKTDYTEKYMTRVDITDEYPFLVTKLSSYYDK